MPVEAILGMHPMKAKHFGVACGLGQYGGSGNGSHGTVPLDDSPDRKLEAGTIRAINQNLVGQSSQPLHGPAHGQ